MKKCVEHSLKVLDIVQKFGHLSETLRTSWCPKLVTGLKRCTKFGKYKTGTRGD